MRLTVLTLLLLGALGDLAMAEDWPAFRGPRGDGQSNEESVPTKWGSDDNVLWKAPLSSLGNSSPIVSNGRVFVHTASDKGRKRGLVCFDRRDGARQGDRRQTFAR